MRFIRSSKLVGKYNKRSLTYTQYRKSHGVKSGDQEG